MELNDEQIERAKKSYLYKKEYYSKYQKENKEEVNKRQLKYLKKVYENPEKLNQMKENRKNITETLSNLNEMLLKNKNA